MVVMEKVMNKRFKNQIIVIMSLILIFNRNMEAHHKKLVKILKKEKNSKIIMIRKMKKINNIIMIMRTFNMNHCMMIWKKIKKIFISKTQKKFPMNFKMMFFLTKWIILFLLNMTFANK